MKIIDDLLEQLKENRRDLYDQLHDLGTINGRAAFKLALVFAIAINIIGVFAIALILMLLWNFISVNVFSSTPISYQLALIGTFVFDLIYNLWINPIFSIEFDSGKEEDEE